MAQILYTLFILISFRGRPVEMAFKFTQVPNNVTYAIQGSNASLVWDYSVDNRKNELAGLIWSVYDTVGRRFLGLRVENKDGTHVPHSDLPAAYKGRLHITGNATLVITNVTSQDSARYQCSLESDSGQLQSVQSETELIVAELPKASEDLEVITCNVGDSAKVTCNATGTPFPQFVWFRSGSSKPLVSGDKYNIVTSGRSSKITINNCSIEDMGYYSCRASIGPLEPSEDNFYLGVPFLIKSTDSCPSTNQNVRRGVSTTICCPVRGFPPPEVTWKLPDGTVQKTGNVILPITPEAKDFGSYTCSAMGLKETDSDPVIITINLQEKGQTMPITAKNNTQLRRGDRFEWSKVNGTWNYVCRIHGADIVNTSLLGDNDETSIEIPYSTLNFKDTNHKPNPVEVLIEVLASDESDVIGRGGPFAAKISATTSHGLSFILGIVLFMSVLSLQ